MEWISVKDRLPIRTISILFTDCECLYDGYYVDGYFERWNYAEDGYERMNSITHWMIIELPKKE